MIKTVLVLPDVHLEADDNKVSREYKAVRKFAKQQQFDEIVLLGDFMNVTALSHWAADKRQRRKMENQRWLEECHAANRELNYLQRCSPSVVYLGGNHESWVDQYVDKYPEMEGVVEIPNMLRLKQRGIPWLPDLYKLEDKSKIFHLGHLKLIHGDYIGTHHAKKHLKEYGCNIMYGHTHRRQTHSLDAYFQRPHHAYGIGCLCFDDYSYLNGKPSNWDKEFATVEYSTTSGLFQVNVYDIIDGKFFYGGKIWK